MTSSLAPIPHRLIALFLLGHAASLHAADRFPVLAKMPAEARGAVGSLLAWQRTLDNLSREEVISRLGPPDKETNLSISASGKPAQRLSWRVSRRSAVQVTLHGGRVIAADAVLVPSANESGPFDE